MKKFLRSICLVLISVLVLALFASCSAGGIYGPDMFSPSGMDEMKADGNYQYGEVIENNFASTEENSTSYFSLDRNTASYTLMRRQINSGLTIAADSVRLEEYINYFNYDYARPTGNDALALSGGLMDCPWNSQHKLLTIGVAAEEIKFEESKQNNIVFLIDTSGSMYGSDRLPLIQQSFTLLLDYLDDADYISIVTYAGDSRIALNGARGNERTKIAQVLQDLQAEGSTNGAGGIQKAYEVAQSHFIANGNNRVILATDGDFNVGISNKNQLKSFISEKASSGIYLSVLGVGMWNTNDENLTTLANNGNGNYAYLDSVEEARHILVEELGGTFNVVAKDAKIGVQFNQEVVEKFRLIGYETKMMSEDEFNDEKKDAGELGSGHTVTAVYELQLKDGAMGNIATAEVRYKTPDEAAQSKSVSKVYTTDDYTATPSEDSVFIGCVVEFGLVLRQSKYAENANLNQVILRLNSLDSVVGDNADEFRAEFLQLVQKAINLYD